MSTKLTVPTLGESITEATVSKWLKKVGDSFKTDEPIVEIETDKITVEVPAPNAGKLSEIKVQEGKEIKIGGVLGIINDSNEVQDEKKLVTKNETGEAIKEKKTNISKIEKKDDKKLSPSVKKLLDENDILPNKIQLSRTDGRITKEDVINHMNSSSSLNTDENKNFEQVVPMSKIRKTIATRLKEAQNTAAILTTFNEVDMSEIIKIREAKKDDFIKRYGVKLGFMSFFIKSCIKALKEYPAVNSEIRDQNIVYKNHFDMGIAVGTERGLVVPVIKNADKMTFGQIEKKIVDLSLKSKDGKLTIEDLSGGTFTISNGGVYGSMLSTPIINYPQTGILGMHNIIKRPVVINDEIVVRPMMYLAFSYDHRIVDGKESVGFLLKIKEFLENPSSIIFEK